MLFVFRLKQRRSFPALQREIVTSVLRNYVLGIMAVLSEELLEVQTPWRLDISKDFRKHAWFPSLSLSISDQVLLVLLENIVS